MPVRGAMVPMGRYRAQGPRSESAKAGPTVDATRVTVASRPVVATSCEPTVTIGPFWRYRGPAQFRIYGSELRFYWWAVRDLNPRPLACHASALPTAPTARGARRYHRHPRQPCAESRNRMRSRSWGGDYGTGVDTGGVERSMAPHPLNSRCRSSCTAWPPRRPNSRLANNK